jgi:hypothetical protein
MKDRRECVESFIEQIRLLGETGDWVKSYIGNKFVERDSQNGESTSDEGGL